MKKLRINSSTHDLESIHTDSFLGNCRRFNEIGNQEKRKKICYIIIFMCIMFFVILLLVLISFSGLMNERKTVSNNLNSFSNNSDDKVKIYEFLILII